MNLAGLPRHVVPRNDLKYMTDHSGKEVLVPAAFHLLLGFIPLLRLEMRLGDEA